MILGFIARIMAESAQKSKTNAKGKADSFIWTVDEVELLLKVTIHSFMFIRRITHHYNKGAL